MFALNLTQQTNSLATTVTNSTKTTMKAENTIEICIVGKFFIFFSSDYKKNVFAFPSSRPCGLRDRYPLPSLL
jgi:hypothetical protein